MFLIDTNIFMEILLIQDKKENCKDFLNNNIGNLNMTDFSLHSVGVSLFRYNKEDIFWRFIKDIVPDIRLLSLPMELYEDVINIRKTLHLDFDDAYQYTMAKCHRLKLVTMDRDFQKIGDTNILFL